MDLSISEEKKNLRLLQIEIETSYATYNRMKSTINKVTGYLKNARSSEPRSEGVNNLKQSADDVQYISAASGPEVIKGSIEEFALSLFSLAQNTTIGLQLNDLKAAQIIRNLEAFSERVQEAEDEVKKVEEEFIIHH